MPGFITIFQIENYPNFSIQDSAATAVPLKKNSKFKPKMNIFG